eukprot:2774080-Pyramimonas_sp.AAC.4
MTMHRCTDAPMHRCTDAPMPNIPLLHFNNLNEKKLLPKRLRGEHVTRALELPCKTLLHASHTLRRWPP